ncbi:MAG: hypothetical protein AAGD07_15145 [Planctomycetota bacterium]
MRASEITTSRPAMTVLNALSDVVGRCLPFFSLPLLLFCTAWSSTGLAQRGDSVDQENPQLGFQIGITGHYRVGRWTALRATSTKARDQLDGSMCTIETTDGDGATVRYRSAGPGELPLVIPGQEAAPLKIILAPRETQSASGTPGNTVIVTRFPEVGEPSEGPAMIPDKMPWVVSIGDPLGLDQIGVNALLNRGASVAVSRIRVSNELPVSELAYDGVDWVLINGQAGDVLAGATDQQVEALIGWVHAGGQVHLSLGEEGLQVIRAADWLLRLLPETGFGRDVASGALDTVQMDPASLETITQSQTRLEPFRGVRLPKTTGSDAVGQLLIAGRTTRRVSVPIAARYHCGLGLVTVMAADLDQAPFVDWDKRGDLVGRMVPLFDETATETSKPSLRLTGFSDLAGQTLRTLDRFSIKRRTGFAVVALVVLTSIALVAPLDYLLVRRGLKKPLLGWFTFPTVVVLLSAGLIYASSPREVPGRREEPASEDRAARRELASGLELNAFEFVDLDADTQTGRGFRWTVAYSHPARELDLQVAPSMDSQASVSDQLVCVTAPFGYPGAVFGGIRVGTNSKPWTVLDGSGDFGAISGLSMSPRSSKSLATWNRFDCDLPSTPLQRRRGSELLQGGMINPLPVDLLDGLLIYRNWAYFLPTRLRAGETIAELDSLRQKNFRWQLSRQRALESASESERWDVTATDRQDRLMEMLMFHQAAGGERYTRLSHQPLGWLDMTEILTEERAVLMGRLAKPWFDCDVQGLSEAQGSSTDTASETGPTTMGNVKTMVRVLLPVIQTRR